MNNSSSGPSYGKSGSLPTTTNHNQSQSNIITTNNASISPRTDYPRLFPDYTQTTPRLSPKQKLLQQTLLGRLLRWRYCGVYKYSSTQYHLYHFSTLGGDLGDLGDLGTNTEGVYDTILDADPINCRLGIRFALKSSLLLPTCTCTHPLRWATEPLTLTHPATRLQHFSDTRPLRLYTQTATTQPHHHTDPKKTYYFT